MINILIHNHKPFDTNDPHSVEIYNFLLQILPKNIENVVQDLTEQRPIHTFIIPPISRLILVLSRGSVISMIPPEHIITLRTKFAEIISPFIQDDILSLQPLTNTSSVMDIVIPPHNQFHMGNICHLNVCLNVLTSIIKLLLPYRESKNILNKAIIIECINALSPVNLDPCNINLIIDKLKINIREIREANETFKSIMKSLYHDISKQEILYWDCADTFIDKEDTNLKFGELIDKIKPRILIGNNQDLNVVHDVDNINELISDFETPEGIIYTVFSCILSIGNHFISVFRKIADNKFIDDESWVLRDDLNGRFVSKLYDMRSNKLPIVVCCYVRID